MSLTHTRTMARYNSWMNEKIYEVSSRLSDHARKEDPEHDGLNLFIRRVVHPR